MYGTVNALCAKLTKKYTPDEPLALIVGLIAGLDGLHEGGVGVETLLCLLENLRAEEARQRQVSVPAVALEKVMALAGEFLRMEEIQGGEGAAQRLYPDEASALRVLRETLGR